MFRDRLKAINDNECDFGPPERTFKVILKEKAEAFSDWWDTVMHPQGSASLEDYDSIFDPLPPSKIITLSPSRLDRTRR